MQPKSSIQIRFGLWLAAFFMLGGNFASADSFSTEDSSVECPKGVTGSWCSQYKKREPGLLKHFAADSKGATEFHSGSNGQGFYSIFLLKQFPELLPEVWGNSQGFESLGFGTNPYAPNATLPLGLTTSTSLDEIAALDGNKQKMTMVGTSCAACHTGHVRLNDGSLQTIWGAPSNRIQNPLVLFAKTATHPNLIADEFRKRASQKTAEWFFGSNVTVEQRKEFEFFLKPGVAEALVARIKVTGTALYGAMKNVIGPIVYGPHKDAATGIFDARPGSMDALFGTYLAFLMTLDFKADPPGAFAKAKEVLPQTPAEIDNPSIWNQKFRKLSHWDGTLPEKFHRNVGAASASLNKPVDLENVRAITDFLEELPSPAYPFAVDMKLARQGKVLFQKNCASCHSGETKVYPLASIGTDPNRFQHLTDGGVSFLQALLVKLCPSPELCSDQNGVAYPADQLVKRTSGYIADRLDGVWARAPYLHNGSVPNLRALLTGVRPDKFYRGNYSYDQSSVGFESNSPELADSAFLYDTSKIGQSNKGHDTIEYLGQDWSKKPKDLNALLEFLKTL